MTVSFVLLNKIRRFKQMIGLKIETILRKERIFL